MALSEVLLLVSGGLAAGVVNAMAGGGSLLTVPLLVMLGLPGTLTVSAKSCAVFLTCAAVALY